MGGFPFEVDDYSRSIELDSDVSVNVI